MRVMNDKQNKTMRQLVLRRVGALVEVREGRRLWFVRIDQTWDAFLEGVPEAQLRAIAEGGEIPKKGSSAREIGAFFERRNIDLEKARQYWDPVRAKHANGVGTSFTGLSDVDLEALELHAKWQVHACRAIYGPIQG